MALVQGTPGDDYLVGTGDNDVYDALGGDDVLVDLGGGDIFNGGSGTDTILLDPEGLVTGIFLTTTIFDVDVDLGAGRQSDGGVAGDEDVLNSIENYTHVGAFNMTITGSSDDNVISTDRGNDILSGMKGDDVLSAGGGTDILSGGAGFDTLTGGDGADRFEFSNIRTNSLDVITDFNPEEDTLAFDQALVRGAARSLLMTDTEDGVLVRLGVPGQRSLDVVLLEGIQAEDLTADNFVFDL